MSFYDKPKKTFDVGRVIERTFGVIGANAASFVVLALLLVALPNAGLAWAQISVAQNTDFNAMGVLSFIGGALVTLVCSCIMQAAVIHAGVQDLRGRKGDLMGSLSIVLGRFLPLIGMSLLIAIGVSFGLILLIVPGIILSIIWSVAVPVLVAERLGVFASLERSRDLTRGNRWWILLLAVILVVLSWIISGIFTAVGAVALMGFTAGDAGAMMWLNLFVSPVVSALTTTVSAAGVAALYLELRSIREGGVDLAAVFD